MLSNVQIELELYYLDISVRFISQHFTINHTIFLHNQKYADSVRPGHN